MRILLFIFLVCIISSCAKPVAMFSYLGDDLKAPSEIKFENTSEKAESYMWDFGDGNTSTEANPDHKYFLSGNYTIKLVAKKGKKESVMTKDIAIDAPVDCTVEMETTMGTMLIKLYDETPKHRDNFIKLAETGYYDGLLFHRVIEGFMVQGGDPNSKGASPDTRLGSGGPSYTVPAEFSTQYAHIKGALCAARKGDNVNPEKKSSGSQFYIVQGKKISQEAIEGMERRKRISYTDEVKKAYLENGGTPFLDQEYTVYGQVIKGMDVIDAIAATDTNGADRPIKDVKIVKVRVVK